jgi:hypothetical protein
MIPPSFLDNLRARLPVSAVVGKFVKLSRVGCEWKARSPFRKERTASFFVNDRKGFYHDFGSGAHGDIFDFVMELEGLIFPQAVERLAEMAGVTLALGDRERPEVVPVPANPMACRAVAAGQRGRDDAARMERSALDIWRTGLDIRRNTPTALYLDRRGLVLASGISDISLRHHPRCPWRNDAGKVIFVTAMIALYRDIHSNEPHAIHRTALTPDGCKLGRKALGPKGGCAIKLTADEDVEQGLHIGEGVETVLAAMMLGFAPAWALGDKGGVAKFPVLAGIDTQTVIVDRDANGTGQAAASDCYDRWTAAGREVWCVVPDKVGADMNDVVAGGLLVP